jgi:spermidine/putrescine-binding protein
MTTKTAPGRASAPILALASALLVAATALPSAAADKELLDILLSNGAIDQAQYEELLAKEELTKEDAVAVTLDKKGFRLKSAQASGHSGDLPS